MTQLAYPYFLFLILPVLALGLIYWKGWIGKESRLRYSSLDLIRRAGGRIPFSRRAVASALRVLALSLLIVALARPQTGRGEEEETKRVIDIMIALDTSTSMATLDFHPQNRLMAAKLEAKRFISERPHDRMGLVIFAKSGITQCPLTTDRQALLTLLDRVQFGILEDGTAIGVGLATAVNRLKESEAKSKVVILLTDGINNAGEIDPPTAARIAKDLGIRVYTIGMGTEGESLMPLTDPLGRTRLVRVETQIDEKPLQEISKSTGGLYFRARDEKALRSIFSEIDRLEKTEVKLRSFTTYKDHFAIFLWLGLAALAAEAVLLNTLLRKIP